MAYGPEPLPEVQHALVVLINPCNLTPHLDYHSRCPLPHSANQISFQSSQRLGCDCRTHSAWCCRCRPWESWRSHDCQTQVFALCAGALGLAATAEIARHRAIPRDKSLHGLRFALTMQRREGNSGASGSQATESALMASRSGQRFEGRPLLWPGARGLQQLRCDLEALRSCAVARSRRALFWLPRALVDGFAETGVKPGPTKRHFESWWKSPDCLSKSSASRPARSASSAPSRDELRAASGQEPRLLVRAQRACHVDYCFELGNQ